MPDKKQIADVFIFRKFNIFPIPGYDQINLVAFTKEQAMITLTETVKDPESFYLDHRTLFIDESDEN